MTCGLGPRDVVVDQRELQLPEVVLWFELDHRLDLGAGRQKTGASHVTLTDFAL